MSMRIHKLATYMQAEEAHTLIEFLEQVRNVLMHAYGDEITTMLQQALAPPASEPEPDLMGDEDTF